MKKPNQRVVITGMGVLSPNGNSLDAFWQNTLDCVSGIGAITRFDTSDFPVKIAGEIKDFDLERYVPSSYQFKKNRIALNVQYGIAASQMAIRHSGLTLEMLKKHEPVPLFIGVTSSALDMIETGKDALTKKGPKRVSPFLALGCHPHAVASEISRLLNVNSLRTTFASECPCGLEAIGCAMRHIHSGKGELVICGGVDAPITPLTMSSFHLTGMIVSDSPDPKTSGRPFDMNRIGGVVSEGASIITVESLHAALNRNATPLAEIIGFGISSDDVGAPSASGLYHSMKNALDDAGLLPADIDYINAHGPGHPVIDVSETNSIKKLFGKRAYQIPVSSIKGITGNPFAAAGGMQTIICVMAMLHGLIPPTANFETPDPECDLNYVPRTPLNFAPEICMINLHGMSGGNISLILKRLVP